MHIKPCHIQNPGLFRAQGIFKSLTLISDDQAYSDTYHSQNSLFKHFQGYLGIFRDIESYSATLTDAQLSRRGEASHVIFENWKKCSEFGKKGPGFHSKYSFKEYLGQKSPKYFPAGCSFFVFLMKCLSKCPSSTNLVLKDFWLRTCSHSSFLLQGAPS